MSLVHLAEAIILQAVGDLWSPVYRKESIDFLKGELFRFAAETAGLGPADQTRLIGILIKNGILGGNIFLTP